MERHAVYTIIFSFIFISIAMTSLFFGYKEKDGITQPLVSSKMRVPTLLFTAPTSTPVPSIHGDSLFAIREASSISQPIENTVTLVVTGDVIPARSVNAKMVTKNDFLYPFVNIRDTLKQADISFVNLEAPFVSGCLVTYEGMKFCGDPRGVLGFIESGVDVVGIANNHMGNYQMTGIDQTVRVLSERAISVTGNGQAATLVRNGKSFTFLAYNDIGHEEEGIAWASTERVVRDIQEVRPASTFVIVQFHWGIEYTNEKTVRQQELAHSAIDAGADLVVGNHPHWVQGVEKYNGKYITYAHGNLIFDQMWSQETREGVIGRYVFGERGIIDISFFPVIIEDYAQPRFATRDEALPILRRMKEASTL